MLNAKSQNTSAYRRELAAQPTTRQTGFTRAVSTLVSVPATKPIAAPKIENKPVVALRYTFFVSTTFPNI